MTRIKAERVTVGYNGHPVVQELSLAAGEGEMLGLIGPNGAGKTTVLRTLAGLLSPWAGAVHVDGRDVRQVAAATRARSIGFVPQNETQAWPLAVEDIVALGRAPHRGWLLPLSPEDWAVVERALALTNLTALRKRPIDKLSGGERQRVVIARALAQEPRVLLLDEPTANLDIHHQIQLLDLVKRLVRGGALTAIIAIHDLALAARYCDRLILLHEGRGFAAGPPEAVLTPRNLREVFDVDAELYRDPGGQWALCVRAAEGSS